MTIAYRVVSAVVDRECGCPCAAAHRFEHVCVTLLRAGSEVVVLCDEKGVAIATRCPPCALASGWIGRAPV